MSAMDGLLKALGAPSSMATKEEDSKEERPHGSDKEKNKEEEEEEEEEGGKENNKENGDQEEEGEEGGEEEEKEGKDTPSLESRRVDIDRVRATGADVDEAKKEEKSATSALAECTATTQRCVAAHASAKARLASTNNILRLAALERRADILRQLESADAAVAVFESDPATPLIAPSVPLVHPFPVESSRALSTRLPTPPATTTFQAQHGSDSETTSEDFPTISANPPTSPAAPDTNDPVVSTTPPTVHPTPPVFSVRLPVAPAQPMPDVASAFDRGTPAHTPPLMPTPTTLAFEMVDLTFFNATLDQIRQAEGIDRQDSEDMSCAAKVLLQFFPDHSDPPTAATVATAVDRAAKDHSSAYISATNTLLLALRGFHDPNGPGARHSWGHAPKSSSVVTTSLPDHVTVGGITPPSPPEHLDIEGITAHRMIRVDGFTTVAYEVHWVGDVSVSWEQELRLQHFRSHITRYWCGTPTEDDVKINKISPRYHQRRIDAAQRESSRSKGEIFLAPGFNFTPRFLWLQKFAASDLLKGTSFWYKAHDGLWWLGEIAYRDSLHTSPPDSLYIGGFVDRAGPIKVNLAPDRYISAPTRDAKYGAWCLQRPATVGA